MCLFWFELCTHLHITKPCMIALQKSSGFLGQTKDLEVVTVIADSLQIFSFTCIYYVPGVNFMLQMLNAQLSM